MIAGGGGQTLQIIFFLKNNLEFYPPPPISNRSMLLEGATNRSSGLRNLPAPDGILGEPWALRTTKQVAELLDVDPCTLSMWRYRGLGPGPEPRYFKGSVQVYRLDHVQSWLAQRQGLQYDQHQAWAAGLERINFEPEPDVRDQVRRLVQLLGPEWAQPPGCRWSVGGFAAYIESLGSNLTSDHSSI
jgi:hypothetical protein